MHKIKDVVVNYDKAADEKARFPVTNYAFSKQFVPGSPKNGLASAFENAQQKK